MPVVAGATVVVVIIALILGCIAGGGSSGPAGLQGSLVSAATGSTDSLTDGESSTGPTLAPTPGREEPSEEEWAALLPKLQEIAAANPGDENAKRKLALGYYNLGRLDDAIAIYQGLLAAKEDPVLRNRLGNALRDGGDVAGAEAAYRKAIADDPELAPPYLNLAELLWRQGQDQEAIETVEQGLAAVPEESRAALEKGLEVLQASSH